LRAARLRTRRRRWIARERGQRREDLLPVLLVRGPRARTQLLEPGRRHEDARVDGGELGLQADRVREQLGEGRNRLARLRERRRPTRQQDDEGDPPVPAAERLHRISIPPLTSIVSPER